MTKRVRGRIIENRVIGGSGCRACHDAFAHKPSKPNKELRKKIKKLCKTKRG